MRRKRCIKCNQEFPQTVEYFDYADQRYDSYAPRCKACTHRQCGMLYIPHPFKQRSACGEYKPATAEYFHRFGRATDGLQFKCKTCRRKYVREGQSVYSHLRRAREKNLPSDFTDADWQYALDYFDHRCAVCGKRPRYGQVIAADHWIAINDARPDNPGTVPKNIVPLCHGVGDCCNNNKKDNDSVQWLNRRYGAEKAAEILHQIRQYFDSLK